MKRAYSTAALGLAILLSVLASSCDNTNGVLSSIQTETASSSTTSTFYRSSVQTFARLGDYYYTTLNAIYRRPVASAAGSDWSLFSVGDFGTNYYCRQLAVVSSNGGSTGTLYAVLRNKDTDQTMKGVYYTTDGSVWTPLSSLASTEVEALYVAGPSTSQTLFAVTNEGSSSTSSSNRDKPLYYLYYLNGSNAFTKVTSLGGTSSWIPGVASDGTYYFTGAGSTVYSAAISGFASGSFAPSTTTTGDCSSLASDLTHFRAYVGTTYGDVYGTKNNGSTWQSTAPWGSSSSEAAVKALIYIPSSNRLIAGRGMQGDDYSSYYYGYYEIALSDTSTAGLSSASSSIGDSSSAVLNGGTTSNYDTTTKYLFVNGFYYDTVGDSSGNHVLFILNNSSMRKLSALWSNTYGGSAWTGWVSE